MKIENIEIHANDIDRAYKVISPITARVGAATAVSKTPTIEDVNFKLREVALKVGANAIINVQYDRGISWTSWKALTASGTAVSIESDEKKCPFCAEFVKAEAIICRFCQKSLPPVQELIVNTGAAEQSSTTLPLAPTESLTSEQRQIMDEFSIAYDGEKFHFREYSYERLSDAVSYAKLQARKG